MSTSTMLATLLEHHRWRLARPQRLEPLDRLPSVLNPFDLRFGPESATEHGQVLRPVARSS